jgi:hypothetical protein
MLDPQPSWKMALRHANQCPVPGLVPGTHAFPFAGNHHEDTKSTKPAVRFIILVPFVSSWF